MKGRFECAYNDCQKIQKTNSLKGKLKVGTFRCRIKPTGIVLLNWMATSKTKPQDEIGIDY